MNSSLFPVAAESQSWKEPLEISASDVLKRGNDTHILKSIWNTYEHTRFDESGGCFDLDWTAEQLRSDDGELASVEPHFAGKPLVKPSSGTAGILLIGKPNTQ